MARYSSSSSTIAYRKQRQKCRSGNRLSGFKETIALVRTGIVVGINNKVPSAPIVGQSPIDCTHVGRWSMRYLLSTSSFHPPSIFIFITLSVLAAMSGLEFPQAGLVPATVAEPVDGDSLAGLVSLEFPQFAVQGYMSSTFL